MVIVLGWNPSAMWALGGLWEGEGPWLTMYRGKECRAWKIKVMAASIKCLGFCGAEV